MLTRMKEESFGELRLRQARTVALVTTLSSHTSFPSIRAIPRRGTPAEPVHCSASLPRWSVSSLLGGEGGGRGGDPRPNHHSYPIFIFFSSSYIPSLLSPPLYFLLFFSNNSHFPFHSFLLRQTSFPLSSRLPSLLTPAPTYAPTVLVLGTAKTSRPKCPPSPYLSLITKTIKRGLHHLPHEDRKVRPSRLQASADTLGVGVSVVCSSEPHSKSCRIQPHDCNTTSSNRTEPEKTLRSTSPRIIQ